MIAPSVIIATSAMCPVVMEVVTSVPLGKVMSPHKMFQDSLFSGGVKVMRVILGKTVHHTEMTAKLSIPIRAIRRRVPRVNKLVA